MAIFPARQAVSLFVRAEETTSIFRLFFFFGLSWACTINSRFPECPPRFISAQSVTFVELFEASGFPHLPCAAQGHHLSNRANIESCTSNFFPLHFWYTLFSSCYILLLPFFSQHFFPRRSNDRSPLFSCHTDYQIHAVMGKRKGLYFLP